MVPKSAAIVLKRQGLDHLRKDKRKHRERALVPADRERIFDAIESPKAVIIEKSPNDVDRCLHYTFEPVDEAEGIIVRIN